MTRASVVVTFAAGSDAETLSAGYLLFVSNIGLLLTCYLINNIVTDLLSYLQYCYCCVILLKILLLSPYIIKNVFTALLSY